MTGPAVRLSRGNAALVALGLVAAGVVVGLAVTRWDVARAPVPMPAAGQPTPASPAAAHAPASVGDVTIALSPESLARATIVTAAATERRVTTVLRVPGIVTADAYRQTVVTPLVGGRVESVGVELGGAVRPGQVLARVYSPDVAEARERLVSARAMLDAHDRELRRLEQLRAIGAASQQELERAHAEHAAQTAGIETAQARLALLGAEEEAGSAASTIQVRAPSAGIVTARAANPGQNVDPAMALFTISDLSSVWVVADVYERDLAAVRVGQAARVTAGAYPDQALAGRVTYIDPAMRGETRTAQVRVHVPNPTGHLRLGMFADVRIERSSGTEAVVVPRSAVQTIGNRQVVYLPVTGRAGAFVEREVRLGEASGDEVPVLSGLAAGDVVVTEGGFSLRAEIDRLGLRYRSTGDHAAATPPPSATAPLPTAASDRTTAGNGAPQTIHVAVTATGFEPARVSVRPGTVVTLIFTRRVEDTCATEVVIPAVNIRRPLPLNQPVAVEVTATRGEVAFTCGLRMFTGAVVAK
ncbi:MAG: efflux RND transporter periplasmic adaptor subunit [Vicinamibacterales bacterium]